MNRYTVLGTTQNVTTCECPGCGRSDLKKTVELGLLDADGTFTGEVLHYGSECAATALGWAKKGSKTKLENKLINLSYDLRQAVAKSDLLGRLVKCARTCLLMNNGENYQRTLKNISKHSLHSVTTICKTYALPLPV